MLSIVTVICVGETEQSTIIVQYVQFNKVIQASKQLKLKELFSQNNFNLHTTRWKQRRDYCTLIVICLGRSDQNDISVGLEVGFGIRIRFYLTFCSDRIKK